MRIEEGLQLNRAIGEKEQTRKKQPNPFKSLGMMRNRLKQIVSTFFAVGAWNHKRKKKGLYFVLL